MIRPLKSHEVPLMLEAGRAFYKEGKFPGVFNDEVFCRRMKAMIDGDDGIIFASFADTLEFQGALAAVKCECPFTGDSMVVEQFWFLLPRYRGGTAGARLFKTFDLWVKLNHFDKAAMIHLNDETEGADSGSIRALYESAGFKRTEINYLKDYRQ
jgi:hypothetical protein